MTRLQARIIQELRRGFFIRTDEDWYEKGELCVTCALPLVY